MGAALSAEPDTAPNQRRCDPIQILWPVRVTAGIAHLDHINTDALAGQERQAARRRSIPQQKKTPNGRQRNGLRLYRRSTRLGAPDKVQSTRVRDLARLRSI